MKLQNSKRGFTIVELVIVIAVIAILAAVIISIMAGVVDKANQSSDTQLIRNLNTALAVDLSETESSSHPTMHSALVAAENQGYNVAKIVAKSKYNIAYDTAKERFVLLDLENGKYLFPKSVAESDNGTETNPLDYFVVCEDNEALTTVAGKGYSIYWYNEAAPATTTVSVGFDAGNCTAIEKIVYKNDSTAQNVVIRTNGGKLVIKAQKDSVDHYGLADDVQILQCASHSYYEYGKINNKLEIADGHLYVADSAVIARLVVGDITVMEDANGNIVEEGGSSVTYTYTREDTETEREVNIDIESNATIAVISADTEERAAELTATENPIIKNAEELNGTFIDDDFITANEDTENIFDGKCLVYYYDEGYTTVDVFEGTLDEVIEMLKSEPSMHIYMTGYMKLEHDIVLPTYSNTTTQLNAFGVCTLDLNGHTLTQETRCVNGGSTTLLNAYADNDFGDCVLNIMDTSKEQTGRINAPYRALQANPNGNAKVTINLFAGIFETDCPLQHPTTDNCAMTVHVTGNSTLNIFNATIKCSKTHKLNTATGITVFDLDEGNYWALSAKDAGSVVNIYGGTIDTPWRGTIGGTINIYGGTFNGIIPSSDKVVDHRN